MKNRLSSLQFRMLLPVIAMALFVVTLLTTLFSRAYTGMILQQEQEVNAVGFDTISHSITPLVEAAISGGRSIMVDERFTNYARHGYTSEKALIHARIECRDYLRAEIARYDGIYGLLFLREDGSMFGALPDWNLFQDDPRDSFLPEPVRAQIMSAQPGQTLWVGPFTGAQLYGDENRASPRSVIIATWKSVDVSYGACYAMLLIDASSFDGLFEPLQDGKSSWHIFAENQGEFYHMGQEVHMDPAQVIQQSNDGTILYDENGNPYCVFSMSMDFPPWTLVRTVSMESPERVVRQVRRVLWITSGIVFLIALVIYQLWQKRFMRQFNSLLDGIIRMGEGDLEPATFVPSSIGEFKTMQKEINRTRLALNRQMDTIRRMEREQIEQENKKKEQERIARELSMAKQVQESALPKIFPAFPEKTEFSLYASMTPAKEVGGDFYDFFLTDNDHLALVIADVSGKGIPAALFMMVSKTLIKNQLMSGLTPAEAIRSVNLQLSEHNETAMFVTVWAAVIELSTGKGLACNAGHENPGLRRGDGSFELLEYKHNMFVGVSRKAKYADRPFELNPGDSLFVYTDGVPEAKNAAGEMYGTDRLWAVLNQEPDASPERLIDLVGTAVGDFVQDAPQFDDLTMLSFKYCGTGR